MKSEPEILLDSVRDRFELMTSKSQIWDFGSFQILLGEGLIKTNGVLHKPGGRAFSLLLYLIENRHRMVSKTEIFEQVWSGLVVEENNLTVQISKLRKVLGPDVLATFSGRGYRFMLDLPSDEAGQNPAASKLPLPEKPSIAVLPFLHLAEDSSREYLTDGITEDITTELSRFRSFFVISRQSSFTYKGKPIDPPSVGRALGVRYVVQGSVRLSGKRIRVAAQLIDTSNGSNVWAEKYDSAIEELFNIQDEIVGKISVAVVQGVEHHEYRSLRSRPSDWGAYEIAVEAYQMASEAFNRSDRDLRERALTRANEALALDPNSAQGLQTQLLVLWQKLFFATATDRAATLEKAFATLERLEQHDATNAKVYTYRGLLLHEAGQTAAGIVFLRKAHEINPNDVGALGGLGVLEMFEGLSESAVDHLLQARRLSPLDPWAWSPNTAIGNAYIGLKEYDKALHYGELGMRQAPHVVTPHLVVAAAHVGLGQWAPARQAMMDALKVGPEFVKKRFELLEIGTPTNPHMKHRLDLLRTAVRLVDEDDVPIAIRELIDRLELSGT